MHEQPPQTPDPEREQPDWPTPRIWVGSLPDYNDGDLYGAWLDADQEPEQLVADIRQLLAGSPYAARTGETAEECAIFDYDNFGWLRLGEYADLGWVSAVGRGIARHGPAFAAWASLHEMPELLPGFEEAYLGHFETVADYVEEMVIDMGALHAIDEAIPESLRAYVDIDSEAWARDMQLAGEICAMSDPAGGVWVFDTRF